MYEFQWLAVLEILDGASQSVYESWHEPFLAIPYIL